MEAKKQLRKPENWEDFESLCKKLWGEVWNCKEIKKNGRKGEAQHGVDVYGKPEGETEYYGIQCKGKDDYTHKQLTETEIEKELEKAKTFNPPLKKFYFATTANKNSKIEEYIRLKDIEYQKNKLFEVQIFSWEDIVELIDENQETHDWYLNLHKYKSKEDIDVLFENDKTSFEGSAFFCNKFTHYVQRIKASSLFSIVSNPPSIGLNSELLRGPNKSYFRFSIKIVNLGNAPINNPQLILKLKGDFEDFENENFDIAFIPQQIKSDISCNKRKNENIISPHRNNLALEGVYTSNPICIKPKNIPQSTITINWRFISNRLKKDGDLMVTMKN